MKMDASCGVIDAAGSWREPMLGSDNSVACWFVMNICSAPIARSSISPASGLRSGGVFETRSKKNQRWIKQRYFTQHGFRNWIFTGEMYDDQGQPFEIRLLSASDTPIRRHVK